MGAWDLAIFTAPDNEEFLDELASLEGEDLVTGVLDAVLLVTKQNSQKMEDRVNAQVAATIAALWNGAPYSASDAIEAYPFLLDPDYDVEEDTMDELREASIEVLEDADTDEDLDTYIEALS
ncbi:MAG: hypothetical protein SPI77_00280 [Corynebacterium sp.]|nr:hypothetical protein [Corynebacterium sp.]